MQLWFYEDFFSRGHWLEKSARKSFTKYNIFTVRSSELHL